MSLLLGMTMLCIVANAGVAIADYARADFVVKNSAEVGVAPAAVPYLASLKLAGALGLAVGLIAAPWLGLAAAIGLVLFFVGAVAVHVRAQVFYNIAFPVFYLLLAVAAAAYFAVGA